MSLYIYRESGGVGPVSQDESFLNPVSFSVSEGGGSQERRYYLRSDDPSYEEITEGKIYAVDDQGFDDSPWIFFAPDFNGAAGPYAAEMEFEIALNSELPFWIKAEVPSAQIRGTKTDIDIVTEYISVES